MRYRPLISGCTKRLHTSSLSRDIPQFTQMRAVSASRFATTILIQSLWSLAAVSAFSFTFSSDPTQCSSLIVNVKGGTAPYRLNLIPAGPLPRGGPEIRTIVDEAFSDKTFKLDALKFPADSQFMAMVSDATGESPSAVIALRRGIHISSSKVLRLVERARFLPSPIQTTPRVFRRRPRKSNSSSS